MGITRKVFDVTGGFAFTHFAEDIELSIRMKKAGFLIGLIEEAFVYHKRRATFGQFFHQVYNFGRGRALLSKVHPEEIKLTHWFPSLFTGGLLVSGALAFSCVPLLFLPFGMYAAYFSIILIHSLLHNKSALVAFLSVPSAFLQLVGYGTGFLKELAKTYFRNNRS